MLYVTIRLKRKFTYVNFNYAQCVYVCLCDDTGLTQDQGRLVYAPPSDMTDELVSSGEAQREMEAVRRVAQLSSSPSGVGGEGGEGGDNDDDPLREEVEEVEEMQASL